MKKSQIGKAVSIALAGSALTFGAVSTASAHVSTILIMRFPLL